MGSDRSSRRRSDGSARRIGALLTATVLTFAAAVHAEPTPAEKEGARKAMGDARDRREAGDLPGALASFQKAHAVMNVPTTGIEVARTQQKLGLLKEAYETATLVTKIAVAPKEPPPFAAARVDAQKMADDLATKIPALNIKLSETTEGVAVVTSVDGAVVAPDARKAYHVNPGAHTIIAKLSDGTEKTEKVNIAEGETKEVAFSFKKEIREDKPREEASGSTDDAKPQSRFLRPLPIAGFALAGVGLIAGSVTGAIAISKASSAKQECLAGGLCPPVTHDGIRSGRKMATVSNISFAVAGVGAAVAIVGILLPTSGGKHADEAAPTARGKLLPTVTPFVGVGSAGLTGTFLRRARTVPSRPGASRACALDDSPVSRRSCWRAPAVRNRCARHGQP